MIETNQGMVIPFSLSAGKMRRSAAEYRRHGQVLDALVLVRRAAEQDDSTAGWHQLATELRQLGCWEAAAGVLGRVLSRDDAAPAAWLDMARCQSALGRRELAVDCLYHQLQDDPWSPEGDAARAMLAELEEPVDAREPRRTLRMAQRGMAAWQRGDVALGERRIRRALRLMQEQEQERLLISLALMHMLHWDFAGALRYLRKALRKYPTSPYTLCTFGAVLQQMGKRRAARGFLRRAIPYCQDVRSEDQFLSTAWAMDAWQEMDAYLDARLKRNPYRTTLLHARAVMLYELGEREAALRLWRQVLSTDPGDRQAAALLAMAEGSSHAVLPLMGRLPSAVTAKQHAMLRDGSTSAETLYRPGSQANQALLWLASSQDEREQQLAMTALRRSGSPAEEIRFLREMLCRPNVAQNMSRLVILRLTELGFDAPMRMLMGERYTTVQCQKTEKNAAGGWRTFLPLLLRETRRHGCSAEIAQFAAGLWECMSPAQRQDASSSGGYLWCKAMEVLWLRMAGREEAAIRTVRQMPVSPRRVSRVLRQLGRMLWNEDQE